MNPWSGSEGLQGSDGFLHISVPPNLFTGANDRRPPGG